MQQKTHEYFARASLDNLTLPSGRDTIEFSGFFIKRSPNCDFPAEDEYQAGFPNCGYYLDAKMATTKHFDFDEANDKVMWALNRLRLFKPGLLWGDLYGIFDPKEHPAGASEVRRSHEDGPMPSTFSAGYDGVFAIQEDEIGKIVDFVNGMEKVPRHNLAVALRRFHLYFDRDSVQDRAIDLMVALESLFSDDQEAIAYKIALRASYLLETQPQARTIVFDFLKNAYRERSKIVHGKGSRPWFECETQGQSRTNLATLEEILRRSLSAFLFLAKQGVVLDPKNLDNFLFFNNCLSSVRIQ